MSKSQERRLKVQREEHRHKFTVLFDNEESSGILFAYCHVEDCKHKIDCSEIERILNDYDRLKRATDDFVKFMDEWYSVRGEVKELASDTGEDKTLKNIYSRILSEED